LLFTSTSELPIIFSNLPTMLIIFNAMRCLQSRSLPSTWCYMNLFLQWILCLEIKFISLMVKVHSNHGRFQRLVWPPFYSWCNQLHAYPHLEAHWCLLWTFFPINPKLTSSNCNQLLIMKAFSQCFCGIAKIYGWF